MQRKNQIPFSHFFILLGSVFAFFGFSDPASLKSSGNQTWKIEKMTYSYSQTKNGADGVSKSGTQENAGVFTFNSDHTGTYSYVVDGLERKGTFKQSADPKIFSYADAERKGIVIYNRYTVVEEKPGSMVIAMQEATTDQDVRFVMNARVYLTGNNH